MKSPRRRSAHCTSLLALAAALIAAAPAGAAPPEAKPAWAPIAVPGPTNLPPESSGIGKIAIYTQNVGGKASSGSILDPLTVTDVLPAGLLTSATPITGTGSGASWSCSAGAGQSTVTCTFPEGVAVGLAPNPIVIPLEVSATEGATLENTVTASGDGAASVGSFSQQLSVSAAAAKPGVAAYTTGTYERDGTLSAEAGSHPFATTVAVFVNTVLAPNGKTIVPAGDPKTIEVGLPPGYLGNPTATPRCTEGLRDSECPIASQVGLVQPVTGDFGNQGEPDAVHAVEAPVGYPAKFTFSVGGGLFQANLIASIRSDEDYGATVTSPNIAQIIPVYGSFADIWGAPANPSHESQRCIVPATHTGCGPGGEEKAFVTLAADCSLQAAQPPVTNLSFDTWLTAGQFEHRAFPVTPVAGCDELELGETEFSLQPKQGPPSTPIAAASPSEIEAELTLPQEGLIEPEELAAPPLKSSVISFPAGLALNPSAANGLATCSLKQIGYKGNSFDPPNPIRFEKTPNSCPEASKVGTLEVQTALLDNPLKGSLYLAAEHENPFGSLLAVYLVIEDPNVGIVVKLAGEMHPDPVTGQLTTTFDNLPQTAVGKVRLKIRGGDAAPLATPDTCASFATTGRLSPWSAPESGPDTLTSDNFEVTTGPGGVPACPKTKAERPFAPVLSAGTAAPSADTYTPLSFQITRKDGEQELKGLTLTLPPGLTGKIAGVTTCADAQIAAAEAKTRSGREEQANPSCPASSQLGTISAAAGFGNSPVHVSGKAYLAGPYKGAPLSVVSIVPAVTGPFDVGDAVTRAATYVDPATGRLTAVSDPIPHILEGIPVQLRSLRVDLDRPGFSLTPTSCEKMSISAKLTGAGGDIASTLDDTSFNTSVPFQVGGCENLAFKPKFSAKLTGGTSRNDHPSLRTVLSYPSGTGYANTASVQVALPHSEFLDQSNIDTVCTRVQFAAKACPAGSIYGYVEASTPLLDEPLSGFVYLRSSEHKLPDLVIAVKGPPSRPLEAVTAGRVDSIHGGIRTTIEGIPDLPLSKVVVTLKGGSKGLLVNSRNLCQGKKQRVTVRFGAHNGMRSDQFPVLANSCKGKRHKKHHMR
jgi:hypothetical protein